METNQEIGKQSYIPQKQKTSDFLALLALLKIIIYRLDMYIPSDRSKPNPVVVFVTGGAWIIG